MNWNPFSKSTDPAILLASINKKLSEFQKDDITWSETDRNTSAGAVYAAINILTNAALSSKFRIINKNTGETADDSRLEILLNPSTLYSYEEVWRMVFENLIGTGNAYVYRSGNELIPALKGKAEQEADRAPVRYRLTLANEPHTERVFRKTDVIAFHGPGFDGLKSPSPIAKAAKVPINLLETLDNRIKEGTENGTNGLNVFLTNDLGMRMTDDQLVNLGKQLELSFTELRKKGQIAVLPKGLVPAQLASHNAADLQLIELKRFTIEDISRIFNVPSRMLNIYDRGIKVSSYVEQAKDFENFTVAPLCRRIADSINFSMFTNGDNKVILDTTDVGEGTMTDKIDALSKAVEKGIFTANEARAYFGKGPKPGGNILAIPSGTPGRVDDSNENEDEDEVDEE